MIQGGDDGEVSLIQQFDPHLKFLGKRLRFHRERAKISQENLGLAIGTSNSYIGLIENGKRNPSFLRVIQICEFLQIDLNDLLLKPKS